ncbi:MAG TPA: NAD(P)-dependent alcohol dehydrogenase [Candidatus Angelobacter sp.]|nr:NAD(P)-dependent alcohol dehydrogenase [Candidatus Angelobacter sp.]
MRSYHAESGGGLASLIAKEHPVPQPGPREVLIRVRANSLNAREFSVLQGTYPLPVKADVVMCADGAGEIAETGPGVTRVVVGDRVAVAMFPRWIEGSVTWEYAPQLGGSLDGMLTEYVVLSEEAVVHLPDHLSFEQAATLPCAAVTAWNALTGTRKLQAGDTVLILGSGGVSLFALQFAKIFGARVIATTSSDSKASRLKVAGADEVINYRTTPDWHIMVREITHGRGVDHVIDIAGGTLERSIQSVALDGQVNFIGRLSGESTTINMDTLYRAAATVRVVFAGSRGHFIAMNRAIEVNQLRPIIDRVFPFDDALEAFRYYETGAAFGKIVISQQLE